ncbi:hypothetical protein [Nostoc sp. FACHB-110]|uniref:hypothetical protein n=1 Tax=Nostoc sp. FACHB-110 TaxID=2692834 RepID=UPI0016867803|nr:hypothetical protein [Nostoc sp. FACHB-110]MBD2440465.1 hypothetical protein [Nostoc sp. FACHB-110]
MKSQINILTEWPYPKFALGQITNQGLVIGLEYLPHGSLLGDTVGAGWRYSVLPHPSSRFLKHFRGEDLQKSLEKTPTLAQLLNHAQALIAQIAEHPGYQNLLAQDYQPDLTIADAQAAMNYLSKEINS